MLLRRIVLLYIVLLLCRIVFYCYNYAPVSYTHLTLPTT